MEVRLTVSEIAQAAQVGMMRQLSSLKRNLSPAHGIRPEQAWGSHIEGACGEMALAKALGVFWSGTVDQFKRPGGDVLDLEVRTRSRHDYDLLVRQDDRDEAVFVLLTGVAPVYVVRGWMRGSDCKQFEFMREHGGRECAYFVPQSRLNPMSQIVGSCAQVPTERESVCQS